MLIVYLRIFYESVHETCSNFLCDFVKNRQTKKTEQRVCLIHGHSALFSDFLYDIVQSVMIR